jgi:ABC-type sugar transport system ATPase subunit
LLLVLLETPANQKQNLSYYFEFENLKLELPEKYTPKNLADRHVCLGIRPESIKILVESGRESEGTSDIQIQVLQVEPHGHEVHLIAKVLGTEKQIILRSANPYRTKVMLRAKKGDTLQATVDKNALHWFDNQTHERLKLL